MPPPTASRVAIRSTPLVEMLRDPRPAGRAWFTLEHTGSFEDRVLDHVLAAAERISCRTPVCWPLRVVAPAWPR